MFDHLASAFNLNREDVTWEQVRHPLIHRFQPTGCACSAVNGVFTAQRGRCGGAATLTLTFMPSSPSLLPPLPPTAG